MDVSLPFTCFFLSVIMYLLSLFFFLLASFDLWRWVTPSCEERVTKDSVANNEWSEKGKQAVKEAKTHKRKMKWRWLCARELILNESGKKKRPRQVKENSWTARLWTCFSGQANWELQAAWFRKINRKKKTDEETKKVTAKRKEKEEHTSTKEEKTNEKPVDAYGSDNNNNNSKKKKTVNETKSKARVTKHSGALTLVGKKPKRFKKKEKKKKSITRAEGVTLVIIIVD